MNFRSVADLDRLIQANTDRVPANVDLIVGIPRSGMLAASLLALHTNLPLTDLSGMLEGRVMEQGSTRSYRRALESIDDVRHFLVVDDSVHGGGTIEEARSVIEQAGLSGRTSYLVAYATESAAQSADIVLEVLGLPRMFGWNYMHHPLLENSCVDIDGVLCRDPEPDENDDGPNYLRFIESVPPRVIPSARIGHLVTARLEKYRDQTVAWLESNGIAYDRLSMMDMPSMEARQAAGNHSAFKSEVFAESEALVFIESDRDQARAIARSSKRPVISVQDGVMYAPGSLAATVGSAGRLRAKYRRLGVRGFARATVAHIRWKLSSRS